MLTRFTDFRGRPVQFLVLLAILLASAACFGLMPPPPPVQDESLAAGQPCLPPCWHGIYPGQTSVDEAVRHG